MGLSSNTLIHFTNNLSNLKGILQDDFRIRYCYEEIKSEIRTRKLLVPMVSFCDIPFSQILDHTKKYGKYGIGLSKKWAEKSGLNPVLYLEQKSNLSGNILQHLSHLLKEFNNNKKLNEFTIEERRSYDFLRYLKNYQADLTRLGKTIKGYRFSDEREWRFVPNPEEDHQIYVSLTNKNEATIKKWKKDFNERIENIRLNFEPNDINYIIIKSEKERDGIIKYIENVKGKFSLNDVRRLTSRIISAEQLRTDF